MNDSPAKVSRKVHELRESLIIRLGAMAAILVVPFIILTTLYGDNLLQRFGRTPEPASAIDLSESRRAPDIASALPRRGVPIVGKVDQAIALSDRNATSAWTTNFFNYRPDDRGPAGGVVDQRLRVGGWGDIYLTYLTLPLPPQARTVRKAILQLTVYPKEPRHNPTAMVLGAITEPWTDKVGRYFLWNDMPGSDPVSIIPPPSGKSRTYEIDVTGIFNDAATGRRPNLGISLTPLSYSNDDFNIFYSTRAPAAYRPRLLLSYARPSRHHRDRGTAPASWRADADPAVARDPGTAKEVGQQPKSAP